KGADVNAKKDSYSDPTALFIALRRGDLGILKLLIKKGADMKAVDGDGWTALMIAMQEGHSEVIKLFQENDKSVGPNAHKNSVFGIFPKASGSTK
ncbi:MAG: ankyrin repeat domain-containing protein, partial [Candidatus Omnitrophica bacterium]|nr:ankyrin repeat domain-containing protein [Candidatus Omnitrophota bacterium]